MNGKVLPGCPIAIVASGSIGPAARLTAQFQSPASIITIEQTVILV
jgi:alcohol dehydrogenase